MAAALRLLELDPRGFSRETIQFPFGFPLGSLAVAGFWGVDFFFGSCKEVVRTPMDVFCRK